MDDEDKLSMISGRDAEFLSLSRFTVYLSAQDLDDQETPTYEQQVILIFCLAPPSRSCHFVSGNDNSQLVEKT